MKKIYNLFKKNIKKNYHYGSLTAVFKENEDLKISKFKLDRWDFSTPFENDVCIIEKGLLKTTGDINTKKEPNELISHNEGISLLEYSKLRSLFAVEIAKLTLSDSEDSLIESIKISALIHDIGLCCNLFQKDLKNPHKKEKKVKFLHNEIGWAFLTKHIHGIGSEFILDCVYWNNGILTNRDKKMGSYNNNNVIDTIDESDKSTMRDFLKEILPISEYNHFYNENIKSDAPMYYSKETINNSKKTFIRKCVISADKLISLLRTTQFKELSDKQDINEIKKIIDGLTKRDFHKDSLSFDSYDKKRLEIQMNIVESCEKTTVVNAPSGFGKSLIGILWNLLYSNKKLIWVCPRNAVAQSVYQNILKELGSLGIVDKINVELYLTGETKKTNLTTNLGNFNSDIIVTNIDNFLSPSINMNNSERLFFINNCDVVFDEYHELVVKEGLFSGFVNIMNVRNRFTNSRTILLSATPLKINNLWDNGINLTTKILPSNDSHYPACHKKKYELYTHELESLETFKTKQKTSSIVILNSISNSQIIHNQVGSVKLIHSNFCSYDKDKIFDFIYEKFDKDSSRSLSKENITGTHVIQASLDISFTNLYESVLSPLSTLQRIGRCNRWGDYNGISKISIYKVNDRSENKMKDVLYTKSLSDKWFDFIKKYNEKEISLDKLYEIYNEFNKINSVEISRYIENCHDKSFQNLIKIFPKHFKGNKTTEKVIRAGANKLRSNGDEIFFICRVYNSEKYSDIISDKNYYDFKDYDEDEKTLSRMTKAMKSIRDNNDDRYNYSELIKAKVWDIEILRASAKESNTPYIRFNVVYHPEYGVIKKSVLNQINQ